MKYKVNYLNTVCHTIITILTLYLLLRSSIYFLFSLTPVWVRCWLAEARIERIGKSVTKINVGDVYELPLRTMTPHWTPVQSKRLGSKCILDTASDRPFTEATEYLTWKTPEKNLKGLHRPWFQVQDRRISNRRSPISTRRLSQSATDWTAFLCKEDIDVYIIIILYCSKCKVSHSMNAAICECFFITDKNLHHSATVLSSCILLLSVFDQASH